MKKPWKHKYRDSESSRVTTQREGENCIAHTDTQQCNFSVRSCGNPDPSFPLAAGASFTQPLTETYDLEYIRTIRLFACCVDRAIEANKRRLRRQSTMSTRFLPCGSGYDDDSGGEEGGGRGGGHNAYGGDRGGGGLKINSPLVC